jgi:hypothetical protein
MNPPDIGLAARGVLENFPEKCLRAKGQARL